MGAVIHLRAELKPKQCIDCANAALSRYGIFCLAYQEIIFDEECAEECEQFEE